MAKVKNSTKRYIRQMVKRIAAQFQPDKIILFGSHARGKAGRDSDVDLLVVMPVSGSRREKAIEIAVSLHDIPIAKDVIVVKPEDFEWRSKIVGTIERPAALEGKLLYARK
ncbi:MAG: nucleotidyltransferase domain-containing protein [Sedimentisphaerales bacterium]|nr:nucleotidyltransferase domain-containing protein [Sedimentisphaerales bacterium]